MGKIKSERERKGIKESEMNRESLHYCHKLIKVGVVTQDHHPPRGTTESCGETRGPFSRLEERKDSRISWRAGSVCIVF